MISEAYPLLGDAMDEAFGPNQVKLRTAANPVLHAAVAALGDDPEPGQADLVLFGELEGAMRYAAEKGKLRFRGIEVPKCPFGMNDEEPSLRGAEAGAIPTDYFIEYGSFVAEADRINAVSLFWPYDVEPVNVGSRVSPVYRLRHVGHYGEDDIVTFGYPESRRCYIKVRTEWKSFRRFAADFLSSGAARPPGRPPIDREMVAAAYRRLYPEGHQGHGPWKQARHWVVEEIRKAVPKFTISRNTFRKIIKEEGGASGDAPSDVLEE